MYDKIRFCKNLGLQELGFANTAGMDSKHMALMWHHEDVLTWQHGDVALMWQHGDMVLMWQHAQ